jgi:hypothetical protein
MQLCVRVFHVTVNVDNSIDLVVNFLGQQRKERHFEGLCYHRDRPARLSHLQRSVLHVGDVEHGQLLASLVLAHLIQEHLHFADLQKCNRVDDPLLAICDLEVVARDTCSRRDGHRICDNDDVAGEGCVLRHRVYSPCELTPRVLSSPMSVLNFRVLFHAMSGFGEHVDNNEENSISVTEGVVCACVRACVCVCVCVRVVFDSTFRLVILRALAVL